MYNEIMNRPMFQTPQQRQGAGIMAGVAPVRGYADGDLVSDDFFNHYDINLNVNKYITAQTNIFNQDLIDSLKRDKFDVLYIHPNLLFVSWERLKNNKRSVKKSTPDNNNNIFKKIDDYNPTGNLLYNDNILSNINSKFT